MKFLVLAGFLLFALSSHSQTCYSISNRTNGNGNAATCGTPSCSGNAKTGHIDINFGAACPGTIPTLVLQSVTSGSLPSPFCFDPGSCLSPGVVRYCFRGSNLPSSGFMTVRLTQGATNWSCTYDVNGGSGTVLPVQLSLFKAKLVQGHVQLQWRTEQELNNDHFEIERSSNGRTYTSIGTLPGHGTIATAVDYSFMDNTPEKGISLYRLKQVDINGHSTYSDICRVDNRIAGIELNQLFPNPVHQEVNLDITADHNTQLSAVLTDQTGRQVVVQKLLVRSGTQQLQLVLPALRPGIYELVLSGSKEGKLSEKLVVI